MFLWLSVLFVNMIGCLSVFSETSGRSRPAGGQNGFGSTNHSGGFGDTRSSGYGGGGFGRGGFGGGFSANSISNDSKH